MDFADPKSLAYLRHDLVIWGDCVKLRYGSCADDSPWLWEHMGSYTRQYDFLLIVILSFVFCCL